MRQWMRVCEMAGDITAYHATFGPIRGGQFEAYTHFGSLKAARERVRDVGELPDESRGFTSGPQQGRPLIYHVRLAIRKPLMIEDGWQDLEDQIEGLLRLGHITQEQADYLRSDEAHMQHVDPETLLKQRGYDGAIYKNLHEDPGSLSYVPWYREQITILDVEPL